MKTRNLIIGFSVIIFLTTVHWGMTNAASVFFPYQGGIGTSTVPTAGQILEGRTGGIYGPANLSAGTNITIDTSTAGIISISASASGCGGVSTSSPIYSGG